MLSCKSYVTCSLNCFSHFCNAVAAVKRTADHKWFLPDILPGMIWHLSNLVLMCCCWHWYGHSWTAQHDSAS